MFIGKEDFFGWGERSRWLSQTTGKKIKQGGKKNNFLKNHQNNQGEEN